MAEGARLESVYTATYRGFESPPHRHITEKSPYASTGFFLCNTGPGDEKPRRGSTTGAARGTEWPQAMTPAGRVQRVNPPLTAILLKKARTQVRAFFFATPDRGMRSPDQKRMLCDHFPPARPLSTSATQVRVLPLQVCCNYKKITPLTPHDRNTLRLKGA